MGRWPLAQPRSRANARRSAAPRASAAPPARRSRPPLPTPAAPAAAGGGDPIGAFISRCDIAGAAGGPLAGVSVVVKDNFDVSLRSSGALQRTAFWIQKPQQLLLPQLLQHARLTRHGPARMHTYAHPISINRSSGCPPATAAQRTSLPTQSPRRRARPPCRRCLTPAVASLARCAWKFSLCMTIVYETASKPAALALQASACVHTTQ